jgi:hypothetical protein
MSRDHVFPSFIRYLVLCLDQSTSIIINRGVAYSCALESRARRLHTSLSTRRGRLGGECRELLTAEGCA